MVRMGRNWRGGIGGGFDKKHIVCKYEILNQQNIKWAGKMTQCIKLLPKLDSLGLIPGTHVIKEEYQHSKLFFDLHMCSMEGA